MRDSISTDERAHRRPLRVINELARPTVRGVPSLARVSAREAWLQVGNNMIIVSIPNRLYGATINDDGEAT